MEVEYLGGIMIGEMLAFEGIDFVTYFLLNKNLELPCSRLRTAVEVGGSTVSVPLKTRNILDFP